jgi:hypothetical protein
MDERRIDRILSSCETTARFFKGVYAADAIKPPRNYPASMVVNLDKKRKPGSHWVAIFARSPREAVYFDSYGQPPPDGPIKQFLGRFDKLTASEFPIQSVVSNVCGYYCIYFIAKCSIGETYPRILAELARKQNMDAYVRHFVMHRWCE